MTEMNTEQIIVIFILLIMGTIAPLSLRISVHKDNKLYLFISLILCAILIFFIYYSLKIKTSLITTVLAYKLFPILILAILSSFVFNEFKFTLTKWIALFTALISVYILEN